MTRILTVAMLATMITVGAADAHCGSCGTHSDTKTSSHSHDAAPADIVDTAIGAGSFTTLVTAVQAADLVETLKGEGPFTVFAPTDEAFAQLPEGTVESLLEDKEALRDVLTYHVVPGRVLAEDLAAVGKETFTVETAEGTELTINLKKDGTVMVDGATVIKADIIAGNGVIHVIDAVVVPKSST
jgi:uncharacterized surface protein with fasciclin (FAS1) repeats